MSVRFPKALSHTQALGKGAKAENLFDYQAMREITGEKMAAHQP